MAVLFFFLSLSLSLCVFVKSCLRDKSQEDSYHLIVIRTSFKLIYIDGSLLIRREKQENKNFPKDLFSSSLSLSLVFLCSLFHCFSLLSSLIKIPRPSETANIASASLRQTTLNRKIFSKTNYFVINYRENEQVTGKIRNSLENAVLSSLVNMTGIRATCTRFFFFFFVCSFARTFFFSDRTCSCD